MKSFLVPPTKCGGRGTILPNLMYKSFLPDAFLALNYKSSCSCLLCSCSFGVKSGRTYTLLHLELARSLVAFLSISLLATRSPNSILNRRGLLVLGAPNLVGLDTTFSGTPNSEVNKLETC